MNKKRMLSIIALAVLIATSVCIASLPWGVDAVRADEEKILSTYISDDGSWAFIAPDGIDVSTVVWNFKEDRSERFELSIQRNSDDEDKPWRGSTASAVGHRILNGSPSNSDLPPTYDAYDLDWFAGSYIMTSKEYGVDAPYETDGTDEPLKYCLSIVEGKEAEAIEYIGSFESYGDTLVVRTSKFGCYREGQAYTDLVGDKLLESGIKLYCWAYDCRFEAISLGIDKEDFNEETFAFIKELANETGRVIQLETCLPITHGMDSTPPNR